MPSLNRKAFVWTIYCLETWKLLNAKKKAGVLLSGAEEKDWINLKQQMEILHG